MLHTTEWLATREFSISAVTDLVDETHAILSNSIIPNINFPCCLESEKTKHAHMKMEIKENATKTNTN
jgi:hypothetical protein